MAPTLIDPITPWVDRELADHLEAHRFLDIVYRSIDVWDDIIDRDNSVTDEDVHAAFTALLIELPFNGFFQAHKATLCPMILVIITSWHAANALPRDGAHGAIGYTLRNEYINLCLMVIGLVRGPARQRQVAVEAWQSTAEADSFDEYMKGK